MNYFDYKQLTKENLIKHLETLSKAYVKTWQFEKGSDDFGAALVEIYGDMLYDTIQKVGVIPDKHFIDFLNLLSPKQLPSKGAEGFVALSLSEGAKQAIPVFKSHPVLGENEDGEALVYETLNEILLMPVKIEALYSYWLNGMHLMAHGDVLPVRLFDAQNIPNSQRNEIIFEDRALFNLSEGKQIEVTITYMANRSDEQIAIHKCQLGRWQYQSIEGWVDFSEQRPTERGVILTSPNLNFDEPKLKLILHSNTDLIVDAIHFNPVSKQQKPTKSYQNEIEIAEESFLMFGEAFYAYDSYYLSSEEVFSKKGSKVDISLQMSFEDYPLPYEVPEISKRWKNVMRKSDVEPLPEKPIFITAYAVEYWNGTGWARVPELIYDASLFEPAQNQIVTKELSFRCPEDFEKTFVGAYEDYWLRIRIIKTLNSYTTKGYYQAPRLRHMTLDYSYEKLGLIPASAQQSYFLETREIEWQEPITLFRAKEDLELNAIYLKCNGPLSGTPIKILFDTSKGMAGDEKCTWQMLQLKLGERHWIDIEIIDETHNLSHTGIVTFIGKERHDEVVLFDEPGYWLRVICPAQVITIEGIYMNAVKIIQVDRGEPRYFSLSKHDYNKSFFIEEGLSDVVVWVDEGELGLEPEFEHKEIIHREDGSLEACWIKWHEVINKYEMDSETRGYIVDLKEGTITFGDGMRGYLPTKFWEENVRVTYTKNLGVSGNVKKDSINRLGKNIAYVNEVFNPLDCYGGQNIETTQHMIQRSASNLKGGCRIRSKTDLDSAILAADFDIAMVKTVDSNRKWVSYVHPKQLVKHPRYFENLKKAILLQLDKSLPSTMMTEVNYFIKPPNYIAINLSIAASITSLQDYLAIERRISEILSRYLDTYKGNQDGNGWHFGEYPDQNAIMSLLYRVEGVAGIDHIVIYATDANGNILSNEMIKNIEAYIIIAGKYDIKLNALDV